MGRWVIVGFVVLAALVYWLSRPPAEAPDGVPTPLAGEPAQPTGDEPGAPGEPTVAADGKRYEFAEPEADAARPARSPWRESYQDGFAGPRLSEEAIEMLENPKVEPIPEEDLPKRYQYDPHIEGLIAGTEESAHKGAVDEFMAENPPGRYQWTGFQDAMRRARPGVPPPADTDGSGTPTDPGDDGGSAGAPTAEPAGAGAGATVPPQP